MLDMYTRTYEHILHLQFETILKRGNNRLFPIKLTTMVSFKI